MHGFVPNFPLLSILVFLPLGGALALMVLDRHQVVAIRRIAVGIALLALALSLAVLAAFDPHVSGMQFVERADWIRALGVQYLLGVDGISLPLVLLTTFLTAIALVASYPGIVEREKDYYVLMLMLETGMLGVFLALDLFLFYIFWEATLIPMYFLIGVWGGPGRIYATIKFLIYTLAGGVLMLLGIIGLYFVHGQATGEYTFDVLRLAAASHPTTFQFWAFLAFFAAFAIKVPLFPFHTWLPDAHTEAPTAGSVILAGVLLKMGVYGFLRFNVPLFPQATLAFTPLLIALALIGTLYGALVAWAQEDLKKMVAYSSVSHLGLVMVGAFVFNVQGLQGALLQMVNHGLSTGALFLIVGMLYDRRHTRMMAEFGGLSKAMPKYATLFALVMLSSIGLPGLNGFVGEFLILVGIFQVSRLWAAIAALMIVFSAVYMLSCYQRTMFGRLEKPENVRLKDLSGREMAVLLPIALLIVWIGVYPSPFLKLTESSATHLLAQWQSSQVAAQQESPAVQDTSGHAGLPVPEVPTGLQAFPRWDARHTGTLPSLHCFDLHHAEERTWTSMMQRISTS